MGKDIAGNKKAEYSLKSETNSAGTSGYVDRAFSCGAQQCATKYVTM